MSPEERENALEARYLELRASDPGVTGDGSSLTGPCGGWAYSFDDKRVLIDAAFDAGTDTAPVSLMGGGQAFTEGNPFTVHNNGHVLYMGFADPPPLDHTWDVSVTALGQDITVDDGGDPNEGEHNRNLGTVDLATNFPLKINFTAKITANMVANDGTFVCTGSGWVEVTGENNPIMLVSAGLGALAGLGGILFNARPARTFKGPVGS